MLKLKTIIKNLTKTKLKNEVIANFLHLEVNEDFKEKFHKNLDSQIVESDNEKAKILFEIEKFIQEIIYFDLYKTNQNRKRKFFIYYTDLCFKAAEAKFGFTKLRIQKIVLGVLILTFSIVFPIIATLIHIPVILPILFVLMVLIWTILLFAFPVLFSSCCHWFNRGINYETLSSTLDQLSKKIYLFDDYAKRLCEYSKESLEETEYTLGFIIKSLERDIDSRLEFALICAAALVMILFASSGWSVQALNLGLSSIGGIAGLIAVIATFLRWLNRRNKKFQIDCFEQVVLLLQLAKNKLDTKD
jgi:hypothetical protein